jgi:transcriptional regulator with XRE-family HTH domain
MKTDFFDQIPDLTPHDRVGLENWQQIQGLIDGLVNLRIKHGFNQSQVGDLLGVSQSSIAQFEDRSANPSIRRIALYALAIGAKLSISVEDSGFSPSEQELLEANAANETRSSTRGPKSKAKTDPELNSELKIKPSES